MRNRIVYFLGLALLVALNAADAKSAVAFEFMFLMMVGLYFSARALGAADRNAGNWQVAK